MDRELLARFLEESARRALATNSRIDALMFRMTLEEAEYSTPAVDMLRSIAAAVRAGDTSVPVVAGLDVPQRYGVSGLLEAARNRAQREEAVSPCRTAPGGCGSPGTAGPRYPAVPRNGPGGWQARPGARSSTTETPAGGRLAPGPGRAGPAARTPSRRGQPGPRRRIPAPGPAALSGPLRPRSPPWTSRRCPGRGRAWRPAGACPAGPRIASADASSPMRAASPASRSSAATSRALIAA